ncbi:MAG: dihydropyrimidine dehydrogenase, partial [Bacteroidales bacterium]|nr:dihydropyrimidine dehydrogenase [Bacteroidales bacterium]
MRNKIPRVRAKEQDAKIRATNFKEVCFGFNISEAQAEASRCLQCKVPGCVQQCPVHINIPAFIAKVEAGDISAAAKIIAKDSFLPAVCGRVCPQESQCEG